MPIAAVIAVGGMVIASLAADNALSSLSLEPKRLEIAYEGIVPVPVVGRWKIATANLTADISPRSYSARARAKATGVLDWFVDYDFLVTSTGDVGPKGLKPARYVSSNKDGRKNRQVTVDFAPKEVIVAANPRYGDLGYPPASSEQKLEAMDPLAALVQLALHADATPDNPCGGPIRAFDGKQRYDLVLTFTGRQTYKSKAYKGPVLNCSVEYVEVAGFGEKSDKQRRRDDADLLWTNMLLAELDGGRVAAPIKLEARSKKRGKMTVQATKLSWGPAPADTTN